MTNSTDMSKRHKIVSLLIGLALAVGLAACQGTSPGSGGELTITVDADGVSRVYRYNKTVAVEQFLEEIGMTLNEDDEVNPSTYTQLKDGMRITITRVVKREECKNADLPYETETLFTQTLPPGEKKVAQVGENGIIQICYLITEKNGVEVERVENVNPVPIKAPRNEIIWVGSEPPETLIPIEGVLAYISNGQALIIEGNTTNVRPLTTEGRLNKQVFELSPTGRQLLYTRSTADENDPEFSNELWAILDTTASVPQPVQLVPEDVRTAQWVRTYIVSYSTAAPKEGVPSWQAYNDLYLMQLDPETGQALGFEEIIPPNALGVYAYWGRRFRWSPDGTQLAWALADSVGMVDLETGEFLTRLTFPYYATLLARSSVWVPTLAWSPDNSHLITVVHGPPYGSERQPEDSVVFDLAVLDTSSDLQITPFFSRAGIWSNPTYSPLYEGPGGNPAYLIAYFQAREPLNSLGTQYDLWVADSDGSNARLLFPGPDKTGFRSPDPEDGIAWSPDARQVAVIYQGNLWIIDVGTGLAHAITSDGQASRPRWAGER